MQDDPAAVVNFRARSLNHLGELLSLANHAATNAARSLRRSEGDELHGPIGADDVQKALRLVAIVARRMGTVRQFLAKLPVTDGPQDRVHGTFDAELASGLLLESAVFQQRAGWTRQALSKAVLARRIFFAEVGGVRAYPAFYLDSRYRRKDLEAITKLLGDLSGGSKWLFFTTPKGSLAVSKSAKSLAGRTMPPAQPRADTTPTTGRPRTPLQALEDGDIEFVKRVASGHSAR